MSISFYFKSTRSLTPAEADAIRAEANLANRGHSWLSAEPVRFFPGLQDGNLVGGSKPNFIPHPDDNHSVNWELLHDFGPLGFIRAGVPDPGLLDQVRAFSGLGAALGELGADEMT